MEEFLSTMKNHNEKQQSLSTAPSPPHTHSAPLDDPRRDHAAGARQRAGRASGRDADIVEARAGPHAVGAQIREHVRPVLDELRPESGSTRAGDGWDKMRRRKKKKETREQ